MYKYKYVKKPRRARSHLVGRSRISKSGHFRAFKCRHMNPTTALKFASERSTSGSSTRNARGYAAHSAPPHAALPSTAVAPNEEDADADPCGEPRASSRAIDAAFASVLDLARNTRAMRVMLEGTFTGSIMGRPSP